MSPLSFVYRLSGTAYKPWVAGQTLRNRCAPGRCLTAIRADRSTLHRPQILPSVFIGRAFRAIFSGSDRIGACLSTRSVWPPKSLCIIVYSQSCHEKKPCMTSAVGNFHSPRFVRRQYIAGFQSDFRRDGHHRRWPRPERSDDLRLATASGAGACYHTSGLIRNPQLSGHTLDRRTVSLAASMSAES